MPKKSDNQLYELSPDAISFLLKLARHAYQENTRPIKSDSDSSSDVEECLTAEALRSIFTTALAPGENHPWIDPPTHKVYHINSKVIANDTFYFHYSEYYRASGMLST